MATEEMIFDFATKRLIPATSLWSGHQAKAEEYVERAEHRITDLDVLISDLNEAKMITDVREHTVIAKIEEEAETLIHIVRRRAAELSRQVKDASKMQNDQLESLIAKATSSKTELERFAANVDANKVPRGTSVHVRLDSLYKLEEVLNRPMFFDAPPQTLFSVVTNALDVDKCISLSQMAIPMRVPPSLAVRLTNNAEVAVPFDPSARGPFGVAPGVFHFFGTGGRSKTFSNPIDQGIVTVSGVEFVVGGPAHIVRDPTSRESVSSRPSRTKSEREGKIIFDFGENRRVCVDAYSLQHGHQETHAALRSWSLVGSNDGTNWAVLDQRLQEEGALGTSPFNTALFDLTCDADMTVPDFVPPSSTPSRTFYRYIALVIMGSNAAGQGNYHIEVAHIELYGRVRTA